MLLALVVQPVPAMAQDPSATGKLVIDNNSRMDMVELYPSNLDTGSWGQEMLQGKTLGYGDRVEVNVDRRAKMLDLRAVFANGTERTYYGIDIQKYSRIRLNTMDMEPFE